MQITNEQKKRKKKAGHGIHGEGEQSDPNLQLLDNTLLKDHNSDHYHHSD